MTLRATRHLTSVFLVRQGSVLLLYRRGSRAIADSWVGIGGHVEAGELDDPAAAALRELHEEVGVATDHLDNFSLRYVAMRDTGTEVRIAAGGPQAANVLGVTNQTDLFFTMKRALGLR